MENETLEYWKFRAMKAELKIWCIKYRLEIDVETNDYEDTEYMEECLNSYLNYLWKK